MQLLLSAVASIPHVVVDAQPVDAWAVTAAIAAIIAALVAIGTLIITRVELRLTASQLRETRNATRQIEKSLELTNKQLAYAQKADLNHTRAAAPLLTATMKPRAPHSDFLTLTIFNSGGTALYVQLTVAQIPHGNFCREFVQQISSGDERPFESCLIGRGKAEYLQFVRIRAYDAFGNKYITEYRSLGETLAYPTFREPWLGKELSENVAPRPKRCSEEVSWPVDHFERNIGQGDEPVETGYNIEEPV